MNISYGIQLVKTIRIRVFGAPLKGGLHYSSASKATPFENCFTIKSVVMMSMMNTTIMLMLRTVRSFPDQFHNDDSDDDGDSVAVNHFGK